MTSSLRWGSPMTGEQRPAWLCTHRKLWCSDLEKGMCVPALTTGLRPSTSHALVRKNMDVHAKENFMTAHVTVLMADSHIRGSQRWSNTKTGLSNLCSSLSTCLFETVSHSLASCSQQFFCLSFQSARIIDMYNHAQFFLFF